MWECGNVGMWECGNVGMWECGNEENAVFWGFCCELCKVRGRFLYA